MTDVNFENLVVAGGVFPQDTIIETVTVANGGMKRGTLLGKVTATGKLVESKTAASDGSQVPFAILEKDIENESGSNVDIKEVVYVSGTFNSLGVTFGTGHTESSVHDALHSRSIKIIKGVM